MRSRRTNRTAVLAATCGVVLPILIAGSPALANTAAPTPLPPPAATLTVINNGTDNQTDPHVSGDLVTYVDDSSGRLRVRYHDLVTGADAVVPMETENVQDALANVDGTVISYIRFEDNGAQVWTFDAATGAPPVELDPVPSSQRYQADIGGPTVAVEDYGLHGSDLSHPEIVAYDRTTGASARLSRSGLNRDPAVSPSGSFVTWTTCSDDGLDCRVVSSQLVGGVWTEPRELSAVGSSVTAPSDASDTTVVYSAFMNEGLGIAWQPLGGGPEGRLSMPGEISNPRISGRVVTFEHREEPASGLPHTNIYAYDLASNLLYRVTDTPGNTVLNDVSADDSGRVRVVWTVLENGNQNVYALSFALPAAPVTDVTAPTVDISTPSPGATYTLRQPVAAAYLCADAGGSGVASCQGSVPVGAPLDTASVGVKTFTVTANDIAGNQTSRSVTYRVSYRVCAGYDQSVAHHRGSTIPLKVRLCDASGGNVSSPAIVLTATGLAKQDDLSSSVVVEDSGNANPDNNFRYDENLLGYIYNLSTRDLSGGTWVLSFTVSDDPTLHSVQFDIK